VLRANAYVDGREAPATHEIPVGTAGAAPFSLLPTHLDVQCAVSTRTFG